MKKCFFFLFLSTAITTQAQRTVINDPNVQTRAVGSFHAVEVSGGIHLYLSQSEEEALAVSAPGDKSGRNIITTVDNGVLKISYKNDRKHWVSAKNARAYVAFKSLQRLKASGSSDVIITGEVHADVIHVELSGASDLKASIEANRLNLEESGASHAALSGKFKTFIISSSGASQLNAYELEADTCSVKASGASDVQVNVNKAFNVTASGASKVTYRGRAVVHEIKSSGASRVSGGGSYEL